MARDLPPLSTDRYSDVTEALNARRGAGLDDRELQQLRQLALSGQVALLDVEMTRGEVQTSHDLTPAQKGEYLAAIDQMRTALAEAKAGGVDTTWIDHPLFGRAKSNLRG